MLDIDVDVGCWQLDVAVVGCWMVTVLPGRFQDDEGTKEIWQIDKLGTMVSTMPPNNRIILQMEWYDHMIL